MLQTQRTSILFFPLFASLLGLSFASWTAYSPAPLFTCETSGCNLFENWAVAGISLWWIGAGAFLLLACLSLLGNVRLGYFCASIMLFIDCLLLLFMAFTVPCTSCLVIALLFALAFYAFRTISPERGAVRPRSWLLHVWIVVFFCNGIAAITEQLPPWIIAGSKTASMQIYFSPSCPACKKALIEFSHLDEQVAFLPVTENATDVLAIAQLQHRMAQGDTLFSALRSISKDSSVNPELSFFQYGKLQWLLLRNKIHVATSGAKKLPFIQIQGFPSFLQSNNSILHENNFLQNPVFFEGCSDQPNATPCTDAGKSPFITD